MATILTNDISRFILAGISKYFDDNFKTWPKEYDQWTTVLGSDQLTGKYENFGNLPKAKDMLENEAFAFHTANETYETTITSEQKGIGYAVSLLAQKGDLYGILNELKKMELMRSMLTKLELISIKPWDDAFSVNQVDGVPMCSNAKPCADSPDTFFTLATGALDATLGHSNVNTALKYMAQQKNSQGDPFVAVPDTLGTHAINQVSVEALLGSDLVPFMTSTGLNLQSKNTLPRMRAIYSHYISAGNNDNWFVFDSKIPHVISQHLNNTPSPVVDVAENFQNKAAEATIHMFWGAASLPNPGVVGSSGA